MKKHLVTTGLAAMVGLWSCKTGFQGMELPNQPPETYTVVDTIIRFGDDRLESEVHIQWWGDDPDGYVAGYEFTFDQPENPSSFWTFTKNQDSVFILSPPPGSDSIDFRFSVRSIDFEGLADPSPASVTYPIKNSPPSVAFIPGLNNPRISFPAVKFFWEGNDPDGFANVAGFELVWNDTTAAVLSLPATASNILLEATDPSASFPLCRAYTNGAAIPLDETIGGLQINSWNRVFIRAKDQSSAFSNWVSSDSIFIKPVTSSLLLVNAYTTASNPLEFYGNGLQAIGITQFDTLNIFEKEGDVYTQQSADNLTQEKIFSMFEGVIWFGNSAESSLSLAQKTTASFFNQGGRMLMAVYISSSFDPLSNFLDFTPVSSLVSPEDTTLILDLGASLVPTEAAYPELTGSSIVGIVKPLNLQLGAEALYQANLTAKDNVTLTFSPWGGNSVVIASKNNADGQKQFVLSALELQKLDGAFNINDFFEQLLLNEFGF